MVGRGVQQAPEALGDYVVGAAVQIGVVGERCSHAHAVDDAVLRVAYPSAVKQPFNAATRLLLPEVQDVPRPVGAVVAGEVGLGPSSRAILPFNEQVVALAELVEPRRRGKTRQARPKDDEPMFTLVLAGTRPDLQHLGGHQFSSRVPTGQVPIAVRMVLPRATSGAPRGTIVGV